MKRLVQFEFRKLGKSKHFYICLMVCIGLVLLGGLTSKIILENSDGEMVTPTGLSMLKGALASANVTLIMGIFIALFVCEDETFGTNKTIYAKGYTRIGVFFSKYIVSLSAVLVFSFASMGIAYLFGQSIWPSELIFDKTYALSIIGQVILVIAYHSLFFVLSSKIGKTGSSIAFNIVCPMLISMILTMGDAFLKLENMKISNYWIDSLFSTLQQSEVSMNHFVLSLLFGIVYTSIFIGIGMIVNKKKEIK